MIVHPSTQVDDTAEPPPAIDGYVVDDDGGRFSPPLTPGYCAGPGPLIREYRVALHASRTETTEECPECDGELRHLASRVVFLEDQSEAEQWRQPDGEVPRAE